MARHGSSSVGAVFECYAEYKGSFNHCAKSSFFSLRTYHQSTDTRCYEVRMNSETLRSQKEIQWDRGFIHFPVNIMLEVFFDFVP